MHELLKRYTQGKQDIKAYKKAFVTQKTEIQVGDSCFTFNRGEFKTERGGYEDYLLSTSSACANRLSPAQWTYRNRKRLSKGVISAFSKVKEGRRLLRKYKIKFLKP